MKPSLWTILIALATAGAASAQADTRKPVTVEILPGGTALEVAFLDRNGGSAAPRWSLGTDPTLGLNLSDRMPNVSGGTLRWDLRGHEAADFHVKLVLEDGILVLGTMLVTDRVKRVTIAWPPVESARHSGRILDSAGEPLGGVHVSAGQRYQFQAESEGKFTWDRVYLKRWVKTGSDGAYRLALSAPVQAYDAKALKQVAEDAKARVTLSHSIFLDDDRPAELGTRTGNAVTCAGRAMFVAKPIHWAVHRTAGEALKGSEGVDYRAARADIRLQVSYSGGPTAGAYFVPGLPWEVVQGFTFPWHVMQIREAEAAGASMWLRVRRANLTEGTTTLTVPEGRGLLAARAAHPVFRVLDIRAGQANRANLTTAKTGATLVLRFAYDPRGEAPGVVEIRRGVTLVPRILSDARPSDEMSELFFVPLGRRDTSVSVPPGEYALLSRRWVVTSGKLTGSVEEAARSRVEEKLMNTRVDPDRRVIRLRAGDRKEVGFEERKIR